jgi:two-component system sensor histidine kinase DegS
MVTQASDTIEDLDGNLQQIQFDLDQARRSLKEVTLMLDQSQVELAKLTQRNATVNIQLQQMQSNIESLPRSDIRQAYNTSLDTLQRLLVMRGQLEKLQSDQLHLKKIVAYLETGGKFLNDHRAVLEGKPGTSGSAMVEMVINAQESERQRLSRQMHDGPAQALSNFIVQTEIATRFFELDPARAKEELNNLKNAAMGTFQKVRVFIFELRPMMLDDLGLFPTMRRYVDTFKEQSGLEVTLTIKGQERRLEPYIEVMIFRALQELLGNAARHNVDNQTKVQITVLVYIESDMVRVTVNDNGKGFAPNDISHRGGLGLKLIRDRVEMLGGKIEIDSAVNQGVKITFKIPVASEAGT